MNDQADQDREEERISDLSEAIGYLLGVHTRYDGDHLIVVPRPEPSRDPQSQRLYQQAWEMLQSARTHSMLPTEVKIDQQTYPSISKTTISCIALDRGKCGYKYSL
jgi:hypothetical protein